jgi:hypothetical protein
MLVILFGISQHLGLYEVVFDHRLNSRTVCVGLKTYPVKLESGAVYICV